MSVIKRLKICQIAQEIKKCVKNLTYEKFWGSITIRFKNGKVSGLEYRVKEEE
jgi:hypothetical protein